MDVILSPNDKAIPCVLDLIRIYPLSDPAPSTPPSSLRSTETLTSASSPNTEVAYKLAAKKFDAEEATF